MLNEARRRLSFTHAQVTNGPVLIRQPRFPFFSVMSFSISLLPLQLCAHFSSHSKGLYSVTTPFDFSSPYFHLKTTALTQIQFSFYFEQSNSGVCHCKDLSEQRLHPFPTHLFYVRFPRCELHPKQSKTTALQKKSYRYKLYT